MPIPKRITDEPQPIEVIINSFKDYALGDIHHNRSKPIAAFILCMCFIDQVASFRYAIKRDKNKKPEDFISEYMKDYEELELYKNTRHSLAHNYSSGQKFKITNEIYGDRPFFKEGDVFTINTNFFIDRLEQAFKEVEMDFRIVDSDANKNAVEASMHWPVIVNKGK